jgi:hypothetical protein
MPLKKEKTVIAKILIIRKLWKNQTLKEQIIMSVVVFNFRNSKNQFK